MKKITKIDRLQNTPRNNKHLRVAAYCRVSTNNDAQLESLKHRNHTTRDTFLLVMIGSSPGCI